METGENNANLIKSSTFNIALHEQYHLSLEISFTKFKFCIINNNLKCEYFEEHTLDTNNYINRITSIINNHKVIKSNFKSVSLSYNGFPNTLVPSLIYNKKDEEKIFKFNTSLVGILLSDDLKSQDSKLLYSVPKKIKDIMTTFFPKAKHRAQDTIIIEQLSLTNNNQSKMFINILNKKLSITVFNKHELILHNIFKFITKEDILYYTLFCLEQLNISTDEIKVVLFGNITMKDNKYKLLYEYIRSIDFMQQPKLNFPDEFNHINIHQHFSLFSQILCV